LMVLDYLDEESEKADKKKKGADDEDKDAELEGMFGG